MDQSTDKGERKGVITRISSGYVRYDGLYDASEWEGRKAEAGVQIVTMHRIVAATRKLNNGQFPEVGMEIPVANFKGRSGIARTGKGMRRHLNQIKTHSRETKRYAAAFQGAKKITF